MGIEDLELERLTELPRRLETATLFSPVIVVQPQIAIAVNGVSIGGYQRAAGANLAALGLSLK